MARKLAEGKKVIVELDSEGFENVFYKNKYTDFLNGVQKAGLGKLAKLPKGVKAFLEDEGSAIPTLVDAGMGKLTELTKIDPHPVREIDLQRARELAAPDVPDTEGLPPFEPFPFDENDSIAPSS